MGGLSAAIFWTNATAIAGVGPITVDPTVQNRAIGRRLMDAVHERAAEKNFAGVRLIQAGFHTRSLSLYAKLGYDVREHLACMQGKALGISVEGHVVRPATEADVDSCNRLCERSARPRSRRRIERCHRTGFRNRGGARRTNNRLCNFIGFFGHAVGETNKDLKALIGAAKEFAGPGFLLPTRNGELFRWCLNNGLRITQPMTLMSKGVVQRTSRRISAVDLVLARACPWLLRSPTAVGTWPNVHKFV